MRQRKSSTGRPKGTGLYFVQSVDKTDLRYIEKPRGIPAGLFGEQMTGIEPASQAWEACVLPLNHICICRSYYNGGRAFFQV